MNTALHFSSATPEHATPQDFFDNLNEQYNFTLDPCATARNAKCKKFYTREQDGLAQSWANEVVFMNPPYGDSETACAIGNSGLTPAFVFWIINAKGHQVGVTSELCKKKKCPTRGYHVSEYIPGIADWIQKAYLEAKNNNATVVCLLPARTDTKYWHTYVWDREKEKPRPGVRRLNYVQGRLRFGAATASAPFPSAVVVFDFKPRVKRG